jgi:CRISPR-associated protein Csb3
VIRLDVDATNPGQFFGCCGLFELAHRLWANTTARFEGRTFVLSQGDLREIVERAADATLSKLDPNEMAASPMLLGSPFDLRLDWWKAGSGEPSMKPWAGKMLALRIAGGMQRSLVSTLAQGLFDHGQVVRGADTKKVEPFYFDARRGSSALPLDIGFSPDKLSQEAISFPATEFFTLIGLQRFRPRVVKPRLFRYTAWQRELPIRLAALATAQALPDVGVTLQFENAFRTDQRKYKAFTPAVPLHGVGDD